MKKICIFDVNETLLDLGLLDPEFEKLFGSAAVRKEWFGQFIQSAFVTVITDQYQPFGVIGSAAFDMIAERHGLSISEEDKKALLGKLVQLSPYPEVVEQLARLKEQGFKTAALTNSTFEVATIQLQNAKIDQYFDKIISAESVRRLKPAKETYIMAAQEYGVDIKELRLIAAHAWDIAGAKSAGCAAAFISRPGMVLDPLAVKPEIVGATLTEVVDQILAADK